MILGEYLSMIFFILSRVLFLPIDSFPLQSDTPRQLCRFHPFHQNEQSLPAGVKVGKEYVERNNLTNGMVSPLKNLRLSSHCRFMLSR